MSLLKTKDVNVRTIKITSADGKNSLDIRNLVREFSVYEDIFSNTLSATVLISSSINIDELLPFTGHDQITISFESRSSKISGKKYDTISVDFIVYKMSDVIERNDRSLVYTLECVSVESIQNERTKINKYFNTQYNKAAEEIFQSISNKDIDAEDTTKHKESFLIPNWKPFRAINFLANRSSQAESGESAANYLFYERINSGESGSSFVFKSIKKIIQEGREKSDLKEYIKFEVNTIDTTKKDELELAKNNVESFQIKSNFNYLNDIQSGSLAGKIMTIDTTRKRRDIYENNYFEDFKPESSLEQHPNVPEDKEELPANSSVIVIPKRRGLFSRSSDDVDRPSSHIEETAWRRNSFIGKFGSTKCIIRTAGDSNVRVGDVVRWQVPSGTDSITKKSINKYLKDKWIVTAVAHKVNGTEGYTQNIELVKDSVVNSLPEFSFIQFISGLISQITRFLGR